jgi:signal transduction histidine kinase
LNSCESVKLLTPLADRKEISINISTDGQHITHGDRAALLELFANLIDNAIKYNFPQGENRFFYQIKKLVSL